MARLAFALMQAIFALFQAVATLALIALSAALLAVFASQRAPSRPDFGPHFRTGGEYAHGMAAEDVRR